MINKILPEQWVKDEQAHFEGWDFLYIKDRYHEEKPPWDYISLAKDLVQDASSLLDMDTGGGEVFSQMAPFPKHTVAIEGWHPNVEVAKKQLEPLGVEVVEAVAAEKLPFQDNEFDLIVNRHGGYNVPELKRVLQSGGQFFTQQVGEGNLLDLQDFFHAEPKWEFNALRHRIPEFEKNGFRILRSEDWRGHVTFFDVGAIVYFLKAIPWLVDDFSVETHLHDLEKLQEKLEKDGSLRFASSRYLLHVKK